MAIAGSALDLLLRLALGQNPNGSNPGDPQPQSGAPNIPPSPSPSPQALGDTTWTGPLDYQKFWNWDRNMPGSNGDPGNSTDLDMPQGRYEEDGPPYSQLTANPSPLDRLLRLIAAQSQR